MTRRSSLAGLAILTLPDETPNMTVLMNKDALTEFLAREMPQVGEEFVIERVSEMEADIRMKVGFRHLRPGGTVSGPSMFGLVDLGIYVAVLAMIGPKALAVTTNANIDFMRKPTAGQDLICKARLLKLGRALAVGEAHVYSEGEDRPVARSSLTYSIPPER